MWPFDTADHVATTRNVVFQLGGVLHFMSFCLLLISLVASHQWQVREAGRRGVIAVTVAIVGTLALGGDLWFETFAVPWLADAAPMAFDTKPTFLLAIGAVSSYLLFSLGWVLFGIASLRARVFPCVIAGAIVIGGVAGWSACSRPSASRWVWRWWRWGCGWAGHGHLCRQWELLTAAVRPSPFADRRPVS